MSYSPKNICFPETEALRSLEYYGLTRRYLAKHQLQLEAEGWTFYVVDQTRGFAHPLHRVITIPLWLNAKASVSQKAFERRIQYILHECAHAFDLIQNGKMNNHGKPFMDILIEICPPEFLIYEMTYKPQNLVKAGAVFCPQSLGF